MKTQTDKKKRIWNMSKQGLEQHHYLQAVLRIRIKQMRKRMRIQEKNLMRMRIQMRIHALTELWRAK
jgi:hypothetical protein